MVEDSTYRQRILDHFHQPRFKGQVDEPSLMADLDNPLCGDRVHVSARVENGVLVELRWQGEGCAVSQAAVDILAEEVLGKRVTTVEDLDDETFIRGLGIEVTPARRRCALLGLECLRKAIELGGRL